MTMAGCGGSNDPYEGVNPEDYITPCDISKLEKPDPELYGEDLTKQDIKDILWMDAVEATKVKKYPKEQVQIYMDMFDVQLDQYCKENGITRQEFLEEEGYGGEDEFKYFNKDQARYQVKGELLAKYICEQQGFTCSNSELDEMIEELKDGGFTEENAVESTGRALKEYAYLVVMEDKAIKYIYKQVYQ